MKRLRLDAWDAPMIVLALGLAALGACGQWNCPNGNNGWCIATPTNGSTYSKNSEVGCAGSAGQSNHSYVVQCVDPDDEDLVYQSTSGTSTTPPPTGQSTWSCTLTKPAPHWPIGDAHVKLLPVGQTGEPPCVKVKFINYP